VYKTCYIINHVTRSFFKQLVRLQLSTIIAHVQFQLKVYESIWHWSIHIISVSVPPASSNSSVCIRSWDSTVGSGARLSPLGNETTICSIVLAPDDEWSCGYSSRWNGCQGKPKYSEKNYPSTFLSTTNFRRPVLGSSRDCCGGKPATNHLIYGTHITSIKETHLEGYYTLEHIPQCASIEISYWKSVTY
jgi:hypothetical protein